MPEFPEVTFQVRYLKTHVPGATVKAWGYKGKRQFKDLRTAGDEAAVAPLDAFWLGNTIRGASQRGKYVLLHTDRGLVSSHLMLKGRWSLPDAPLVNRYPTWAEPPPEWARGLWLDLADGRTLTLYTPAWQASATIHPGVHRAAQLADLTRLGPEVLIQPETDESFRDLPWKLEHLVRAAKASGKAIKLTLMDQAKVSGLGNRYVCEALYHTRVDPARPARDLSATELEALYTASVDIVRTAIDTELDYDSFLCVYRRETDRDGRPVVQTTLNGRDTFAVPELQR